MSASLLLSLAMSVGQPPEAKLIVPPPPPPPGVVVPVPPPTYTPPLEGRIVPHEPVLLPGPYHPNFTTPPPSYYPYLYPYVPQPVVVAHPDWYPYPGPVYWYRNEITPYHPVVHPPMPPKAKDEKKKKN